MLRSKARRQIDVGNETCLLGFSGRDDVDTAIFDSSTLSPGGINEVQRLVTTGVPTGGTFKLTFKGQTTAALAYNATAAAIQTELRKLTRLGNVTCSGGALPTAVDITFTGKLAAQDVPLITVSTPAFTGGTAPAASVTELTKGDSTGAGLLWLKSGLPLMATADGKMVQEWDGASATTLVGIFDGQKELLSTEDYPSIPVYNFQCAFDKAKVKNYTTNAANFNTWAQAHSCVFKSQGT